MVFFQHYLDGFDVSGFKLVDWNEGGLSVIGYESLEVALLSYLGLADLSSEKVGNLQLFPDVDLLFLLDQMFFDLMYSFLLLLFFPFLNHGLKFLG